MNKRKLRTGHVSGHLKVSGYRIAGPLLVAGGLYLVASLVAGGLQASGQAPGQPAQTSTQAPQQPSEIAVVISGDPGTPPRYAVPDFIAATPDAAEAAKTITQ